MNFSTERCSQINVTPEADVEFLRLLEKEDPKRYQALLALQRFGDAFPDRMHWIGAQVREYCSHCRGGLSFVRYTIIHNADAYCSVDCMKQGTIGTPEYDLIASRYFRLDSKEIKPKKNGRPKLKLSVTARRDRRNGQYRRANANRPGTTKTPLNPTETKVDAGAIFENAA